MRILENRGNGYDTHTRHGGHFAPSNSKPNGDQVLLLSINTIVALRIVMPLAAGPNSQNLDLAFGT